MAPTATTSSSTAPAADHRLGLTTLRSEVAVDDLQVSGRIPCWLHGSLLRNGPAQFEVGTIRLRHWFEGLAMLHRFTIAGGRVSYANRFLSSRARRTAEQDGRLAFRQFATDPCRSLFARVTSLFSPRFGDNANISLGRLGADFVALTETPMPVLFDPRTLESAGVAYAPPGHHSTAHPHHDRASREMIGYATRFGLRSSYEVYVQSDRTRRRSIASLPVRTPAYMHSFGMSERFLVLVECPLVVDPLRLLLSGRPFIENYRWEPDRGTAFVVVDRADGQVRGRYVCDPMFAFHQVNAVDRGRELVLDMVAYPDARVIDALSLESLRRPAPRVPLGELRRVVIGLDTGDVRHCPLSEEGIELPRIHYERCNARPYRHVYGCGLRRSEAAADGTGGFLDQVVKVDVETGVTASWHERRCYPGEPVFVPRPGAVAEDGGVLLSVVLDAGRGTSFLLVLDAGSLDEVARAEAPHPIPFGFHGDYVADLT